MRSDSIIGWMTKEFPTLTTVTTIHEAQRSMRIQGMRVLPVLENTEISGVVTYRDLHRADISIVKKENWDDYREISKKIVAEVMAKKPVTILESENVAKAARILLEAKITALPVLDRNSIIVGMITAENVLEFLKSELSGYEKPIFVADLMTRHVISINHMTTLLEAHRIMGTKRIRALPIVEDRKIVGIVTRTDLLAADPSTFTSKRRKTQSMMIENAPVEYFMTANPETVSAQDQIPVAIKKLLEFRVHCLPVINEKEELIGIISEVDLLHFVVQKYL